MLLAVSANVQKQIYLLSFSSNCFLGGEPGKSGKQVELLLSLICVASSSPCTSVSVCVSHGSHMTVLGTLL